MRYLIIILLTVYHLPSFGQPENSLSAHSSVQSFFLTSEAGHQGRHNWQMVRVSELKGDGALASAAAQPAGNWQKAIVPGTVLTSLVVNGVYPDPYFGDNNRRSRKLIPDINEVGNEFYHYWYRTSFNIPAAYNGKRIWLKLHGINYRAEVWLNGKKLGDLNGMFNAKAFDITEVVRKSGQNALAISVKPVDVPGTSTGPKLFRQSGAAGENSNGGNGEIGQNVTMLMSVGWDFTAPDGIRDRNTGIWRDVEIYTTGDVTLEHSFIWSQLPLPDTSTAKQTVSVEVVNVTDKPQQGIVSGLIRETGTRFQKTVALKPRERQVVEFRPGEYKQLIIKQPKLWWPVNKGNPNLYTLELRFQTGAITTDVQTVRFGIRQITSDQQTPDKSRRFLVNGVPVFIRGTNWIPEAMLRNSAARTRAELRYTRQAGLNLIRLWGGGIAESDYFYQLCDEMGILVWNEYWITGDTRFPADTALYLDNIRSTVKRIRNHAALAYHVSSNESTEIPEAAALIKSLDPSRGYQMQSECCGVHDGSPYKYENPMQYFENTASKRGSRVDGFNPEYGTLCLPTISSLRKLMPEADLWPINKAVWDYLDGGGFHQVTTKYKDAIDQFGPSASIDEFARKAQFVGAMNYRAIWEVWNYNKFGFGDRWASGFLFWYHNSPLPQTASRMYDWYLEPTAALYYSQSGLRPLHAQFDYGKNTVSVYNDYRKGFNNYKLIAEVYDLRSAKAYTKETTIDIPADGVVKDAIQIAFPADITPVHFIKLRLLDNKGNLVDDPFYWRSTDAYKGAWTLTGPATAGFQSINSLEKIELKVSPIQRSKDRLTLTVSNPSPVISFFTELKLQDFAGRSIAPVFYSDNFFNLLPGESKTISIDVDQASQRDSFNLVTEAFNARRQFQGHVINRKAETKGQLSAAIQPASILAVMNKAAQWQINEWKEGRIIKLPKTEWENGALYTGIVALQKINKAPAYDRFLYNIGEEYDWNTGKVRLFADDYCIAQMYTGLYMEHREPKMIAKWRALADTIVNRRFDEPLTVAPNLNHREWAWCDALFMGPPGLAMLTTATGDPRYLSKADSLWWKTSAFLYDTTEHLYYRDSRFFTMREKNGAKIFWSRGNGWVMAGLARMMDHMPATFSNRKPYEKQFKEMAERVAALQQPDGSWHASLLDPVTFATKETSGTAFYCYALAWGINRGLLPAKKYKPVVEKAWHALVTAVHPEGKLGFVQNIGSGPITTSYESTNVYGVGALLLAGCELYHLAK